VVLVNLDLMKVIISSQNLVLFEHERVPQFIHNLKARLEFENSYPPAERSPYEFIALEAVLITVCDELERRYHHFRDAIQGVLDQHGQDKNEAQALNSLRPLKYGLAEFHMQVKESAKALDTVLKSDEDMAEMYLTDKAQSKTRREVQAHEEMEVLLETYFRKIQEVENELTTLSRNIVDTENEIQILLDSTRNTIMKMELLLSINTVAIASGALVAGAFGMNLTSGIEHHPYAFYYSSAALLGMSVVTRYFFVRQCRNRNISFDLQSMFNAGGAPRWNRRAYDSALLPQQSNHHFASAPHAHRSTT